MAVPLPEEAAPCLLQLQVLGSSCMPTMPSAAPSGALQEWGEEQGPGARRMLEQPPRSAWEQHPWGALGSHQPFPGRAGGR